MMKTPIRFPAFAIATFTFPAIPAHAQTAPDVNCYDWGQHMAGWSGGWLGMLFGPVFMILVLVAVIAVAVLVLRWLGPAPSTDIPHGAPIARTPLDILRERFAHGEIDKAEFEERRRILDQ